MAEYPESVLTKNRKGETEVRNLISSGTFVKYNYLDPETGRPAERGKFSIITRDKSGRQEHYFMIPVKGNRFLSITESVEKERHVWDSKNKKAVNV